MFDWSKAELQEECDEYKRLDELFKTSPDSPLHHDNRCPLHKVQGTY